MVRGFVTANGMEKKRTSDEFEPGPIPPSQPVDRLGFIKQEQNSPDGITKSRLAGEHGRYGGYTNGFVPLQYCLQFPT